MNLSYLVTLFLLFYAVGNVNGQKNEISFHTGINFIKVYDIGYNEEFNEDKSLYPALKFGFELATPLKNSLYIKAEISFSSVKSPEIIDRRETELKVFDILLENRFGKKRNAFVMNAGFGYAQLSEEYHKFNKDPIIYTLNYLNFSANVGYCFLTDRIKIGALSGLSTSINKVNPIGDQINFKIGYTNFRILPHIYLGIRI